MPKAKKGKTKSKSKKGVKKKKVNKPLRIKQKHSKSSLSIPQRKGKKKKKKVIKRKKPVRKKKLLSNLRERFLSTKNIKRFIFFGLLSSSLLWVFWGIPIPTKLADQVPVSTKLFDRNDKLIYEIFTEKRSTPYKLDDIPEHVKHATIAIEDKDFYKHYGVSFTGVVRAIFNTVFKRKLQGGSTLTQQLVKNALLTPERTIKRKIREFALTLVVETIYSKNQILELYLNQIPYGGTAYGIGAASETYFDKDARELSLAEAALLAGLPAAPSRYSPFGAHPELAKGRQETVLRRMVEDRYINQEEADKAKDKELKYAEPEEFQAPHFALWVKEQLAEKYGEAVVEKGGLRVTTTLDLDLQNFAQVQVATEVAELKKSNVGNGIALVTRPKTGEILAMVGSKNYFAEDEDGKVNVILAERQPGSSIKPLNYALAIRDEKITLSTPLADVPSCFSVFGQPPFCPRNYDFEFHGAVQARFALGNSYNIPAVRVLALNGIENFVEFARLLGITNWEDPSNYGLSLTLGGGEVRPYDMAVAFGVFANQGIKQPLISVLKVVDWKGKVLHEEKLDDIELSGERALEPEVTFLISHILHDNNARSNAFGTSSQLRLKDHPEVSVKTGTTNNLRDNWTIGYTANALVVTWVGNNDNSEMSRAVSGVSGASPIWNKIMSEVLDKAEDGFYSNIEEGESAEAQAKAGHSWPRQPDGIVGKNVCTTSGIVPPEGGFEAGCPTRFEYFLEDNIPTFIEGGFQDVHYDNRTGLFINEETPPEFYEIRQNNVIYDPLGTFLCLDCPVLASSQSAKINYPVVIDSKDETEPQLGNE